MNVQIFMSTTMVQIRNVPAEFHRRLNARAAAERLTDYPCAPLMIRK